jgi:hypothetical protein
MRTRLFSIVLFILILVSPILAGAAVPGPIKVSPNGRYFVDRDGKPFFWLGDTASGIAPRRDSRSSNA